MARAILQRTFHILLPVLILVGVAGVAYVVWQPGMRVTDGRHDRRSNGIWIQHGWLGDDAWFDRYEKDRALFRDDAKVDALAQRLASHGIKFVYPHLCPCQPKGEIAAVDHAQTLRFLDRMNAEYGFRVLPWIGGVLDVHAFPDNPKWRERFVASTVALLAKHPRFAGVHVNIEPLPSGHAGFLALLDELRAAMPADRMISIAAYPPPTRWHPHDDLHWDEAYFRQVADRCDQLVPMMYDTALSQQKLYQQLMASWTQEVLTWSNGKSVLLGLPAYDIADVGYHDPDVENLTNALLGIHAGLCAFDSLPMNYTGVAIYCEWEMTEAKWRTLKTEFECEP